MRAKLALAILASFVALAYGFGALVTAAAAAETFDMSSSSALYFSAGCVLVALGPVVALFGCLETIANLKGDKAELRTKLDKATAPAQDKPVVPIYTDCRTGNLND